MSAEAHTEAQDHAPAKAVGEWIWRFLAAVLLFSVGWVLWIAYQLNPPMLVTTAAFEAAAKAKATQNAAGTIAPKPEAAAPQPDEAAPKPEAGAVQAVKTEAEPEPEAKAPPVNVERLKLSESITLPLAPEAKKK